MAHWDLYNNCIYNHDELIVPVREEDTYKKQIKIKIKLHVISFCCLHCIRREEREKIKLKTINLKFDFGDCYSGLSFTSTA